MTEDGGLKKRKGIFAWIIANVFQSGWRRWLIFVVALALFLLLVSFMRGGVDYRKNPSALVSRDALLYLEARNIDAVMRHVGMWPLWNAERRAAGDEQWNHVQALLASAIGESVHGFGSRLPINWLTTKNVAAFAVLDDPVDGSSSWIFFFLVPNPQTSVNELRQEPGIVVQPHKEAANVYEITGDDDSVLSAAVVGPWLAVTPKAALLSFAQDAVRRPAVSLSSAVSLPGWRGDGAMRGVLNPKILLGDPQATPPLARMAAWMQTDVRLVFSIRADAVDKLQINAAFATLGEVKGDGWFWGTIKFILKIVALLCLLLAAAIILAILGWAGWLKTLAIRAGIRVKEAPEKVTPSAAFAADAGVGNRDLGHGKESKAEDAETPDNPMVEQDVDSAPEEPNETFPETIDAESLDPLAGHLPEEDNPVPGGDAASREDDGDASGEDDLDPAAGAEAPAEEKPSARPRRRLPRKKKTDEPAGADEYTRPT